MDDEKRLLVEGSQAPPRRSRQKSRAAHLVVAAIALCWVTWRLLSSSLQPCPQHDGLLSYPGESIKWKPCGRVDDHDLECSDVDVPMDHFDPQNSGDKTFSIAVIRLRGKNATQNLFLNPGGPGGSGVGFVYGQGAEINAVVGENFHLLSFDPRGVNASRPLASCYPDDETRGKKAASRWDADPVNDSPARYAWTKNFVRACEENMGEHGKYINTPQTAADMNSILDAVGQENMAYWGFSYGSLLGQTYAALYPERSSRVIIDGVVNVFEWYNSPLLTSDFTDSQRVLDGFFDECVKAGDRCALSPMAKSGAELSRKVIGFLESLKEEPATVYLNTTTYGLLDYRTMWYNAVFRALYVPSGWAQLADRLASMMNGNATDAFLAYSFGDVFGAIKEANDVIEANDGVCGPEHWPQERQNLTDALFPLYEESRFASARNRMFYARQQWAIPRTHSFVPRNGTQTAHPLLVLSTTYDPVCPLASAKIARAAFEGSRLIEVKGYGHCSLSVPSKCLAKHVRGFLLDGTLPDEDVQCEVDRPYFTRPEDEDAVAVSAAGESDEDRIWAAQISLAEDMTWLQGRPS